MNKIAYFASILCLAGLSLSAKADTLKFDGSATGSTGPYQLELNGTPLNLFCMDDFRRIQTGESWDVTVVNGANYLSSNKHSTNFKYEQEAYIYSQFGVSNGHGHTYNNNDVQQALWSIFDDEADTNWYADALIRDSHDFHYTTAFLSNVTFYIPTGNNIVNGEELGLPQEMIGAGGLPKTPEPSSLILMGSGLAGLAGAIRRRFTQA